MEKHQSIFKKKELVLAVSIAMLGGVMTGCTSSSDDSVPTGYSINATGGMGGKDGGTGGDGAEYISIYSGGALGGVEVSRSDRANTNFTSPIPDVDADLGDNPLMITADTTIDDMATLYTPVADGSGGIATWVGMGALYVGTNDVLHMDGGDGYAGAAGYGGYVNAFSDDTRVDDNSYYRSTNNTGELFQAVGDNASADLAPADTLYLGQSSGIYVADGYAGAADPRVSGISVARGRTLTLGMNSGSDTYINVNDDIENNGTITKTDSGESQLNLYPTHYLGSGNVDNAGNVDRPNGGEVYISAMGIINDGRINVSGYDDMTTSNEGDGGNVDLSGAYIQNNDDIDASGGDAYGVWAGNGGSVNMSGMYTENNGRIDISGGDDVSDGAEFGIAGNGGNVDISSNYGTNNTANIDASGGNGGEGGFGGSVHMGNNSEGIVRNAGNINVSGGASDDSYGQNGGYFGIHSYDGTTINSGNVNATGGSTSDDSNNGGDGGEIQIYTSNGGSHAGRGDVLVSGNLDVSGGDAVANGTGSGGDAGGIDVYNELFSLTDQRIALLGYKAINVNGGDGHNGGDSTGYRCCGNGLEMYANSGYDSPTDEYMIGSVSNDVPINAQGGNSVSSQEFGGNGGYGGEITFGTDNSSSIDHLDAQVTNSANIDARGGNSTGDYWAGYGGGVDMYAYHGVTNSGKINLDGGDGGEFGGWGGWTHMYVEAGTATNSGAITADGGYGAQEGGHAFMYGNSINIYGYAGTVNSASLSADGGNADNPYEGDSYGGNGGYINLNSSNPVNTTSTGSITYSFGTGETDGNEGCATIGINQEGNCGMPK